MSVTLDVQKITKHKSDFSDLSSAESERDEWCTDCKEYDHERHCCPRFNRVIRNALKDAEPKERTEERTETHACD